MLRQPVRSTNGSSKRVLQAGAEKRRAREGEQGRRNWNGEKPPQDVGPQGKMERVRKGERHRETDLWATSTPHPLQRAFMRPCHCLSQHSDSKFLRGLWTGRQWVTAARKSFIQQHSLFCSLSLTHTHTHLVRHISYMHTVCEHTYLSERESRNLGCYF